MEHSGSRSGAANLAIPLMIVAFLAIAGFLWWLSLSAEGTTGPVDTAQADTAEATGPTATQIELADLQERPDSLVGQSVRVAGASVASRMGNQAFWIELPNQNPFLVRLGSALVQDSVQVQQDQTVTVTGNVHSMSDSVLTAWMADSVITEGQRLEAEFATHFIEATQVQARGGQGGGGQGGEGEQDGGGDAG